MTQRAKDLRRFTEAVLKGAMTEERACKMLKIHRYTMREILARKGEVREVRRGRPPNRGWLA